MSLKKIREKLKEINYLLTEEEVATLYKYAKKVPEGGIIVDIGTAEGGSAFTMALASKPSVKVYTIDPMKNTNFLDKVSEWNLWGKITYYNEASENAEEHFKEKKLDLLFIDGVHSFVGVMNDFVNFGGRVKKGGIVVFHDYYLYGNTIGTAVDEIVKSEAIRQVEIIDSLFNGDKRVGMFIGRKL